MQLHDKKWRQIYDFEPVINKENLFATKVIHVPSKILLMIGGASGKLGIWRFCLKSMK